MRANLLADGASSANLASLAELYLLCQSVPLHAHMRAKWQLRLQRWLPDEAISVMVLQGIDFETDSDLMPPLFLTSGEAPCVPWSV